MSVDWTDWRTHFVFESLLAELNTVVVRAEGEGGIEVEDLALLVQINGELAGFRK